MFAGHYHDGGYQQVNGIDHIALANVAYGNDASYHNQYATVDVRADGKIPTGRRQRAAEELRDQQGATLSPASARTASASRRTAVVQFSGSSMTTRRPPPSVTFSATMLPPLRWRRRVDRRFEVENRAELTNSKCWRRPDFAMRKNGAKIEGSSSSAIPAVVADHRCSVRPPRRAD